MLGDNDIDTVSAGPFVGVDLPSEDSMANAGQTGYFFCTACRNANFSLVGAASARVDDADFNQYWGRRDTANHRLDAWSATSVACRSTHRGQRNCQHSQTSQYNLSNHGGEPLCKGDKHLGKEKSAGLSVHRQDTHVVSNAPLEGLPDFSASLFLFGFQRLCRM